MLTLLLLIFHPRPLLQSLVRLLKWLISGSELSQGLRCPVLLGTGGWPPVAVLEGWGWHCSLGQLGSQVLSHAGIVLMMETWRLLKRDKEGLLHLPGYPLIINL